VAETEVGRVVLVKIFRDGKEKTLTITIGKLVS
jgi:S1-C subfamily serine protease